MSGLDPIGSYEIFYFLLPPCSMSWWLICPVPSVFLRYFHVSFCFFLVPAGPLGFLRHFHVSFCFLLVPAGPPGFLRHFHVSCCFFFGPCWPPWLPTILSCVMLLPFWSLLAPLASYDTFMCHFASFVIQNRKIIHRNKKAGQALGRGVRFSFPSGIPTFV